MTLASHNITMPSHNIIIDESFRFFPEKMKIETGISC